MELLYGKTPFDNFPSLKILHSKLNYPCPGYIEKKQISPVLNSIIARCIDKDSKQRPTALEVLDECVFRGTKSRAYLKKHLIKFAIEDMSLMGEGLEHDVKPS